MGLRDQILAAQDIRKEPVVCDDWLNEDDQPITVEVRTMTGRERADMYERFMDPETGNLDVGKMQPNVVIAATFDPTTGEKVFSEADMEPLLDKSSAMLEKIGKVALRLSGMTEEAKKDAVKNSPTTPSDASTTG